MNPQNRKEMFIYRVWLLLYALLGELYKLLINFCLLRPNKLSVKNVKHPKIVLSLMEEELIQYIILLFLYFVKH